MSVNDIRILLSMAENLLATAEKLPSGPERSDALQMIRKLTAEIAVRVDRRAVAVSLRARTELKAK
jgi:hypothetical protein